MTDFDALIVLAALLIVKHVLGDGPLQTDYQARNKGVLGHAGGLFHAGTHVILTAACFAIWSALLFVTGAGFIVSLTIILTILFAEFTIHYFVDYAKSNLTKNMNLSSISQSNKIEIESKAFFTVFLFDQAAHHLTYILMIYTIGNAT